MNDRLSEMYQMAAMYYIHGDTMDMIARQFGVSRSTVSRLLKDARESGMVSISLGEPIASRSSLSTAISKRFRVRAHIVTVKDGFTDTMRLDRVARVAAGLLTEALTDGATVGVAWGTTLAAIADKLPHRHVSGISVVQLNGAANPTTSGVTYASALMTQMGAAWHATLHLFPVPAFFDHVETKEWLWREQSIRRVIDIQNHCDVAVFGVGSLEGPVPSHVYSGGYLSDADMRHLRRDNVVGDVCTVFLREDGSWRDITMNARASGPTPAALTRIPRRFCVVAHAAKVPPLLGALRAGVVTDLIIDEDAARALLAKVGS